MKKYYSVILAIAFSLPIIVVSCEKGENDPFLSMKSRTARITGDWELSESLITTTYNYTGGGNNNSQTVTSSETINGTAYSVAITSINETNFNGNESQTITTTSGTGTISRNLSIEKDGTFKSVEVKNVNFVSAVQGQTNSTEWIQTENTTTEGLWYWAGKNKENDTGCKEVIILQTTSESLIYSQTGDYSDSGTNLSIFEGNDCPMEYNKLDRLTSKEFVLRIENSDTNDNSSSTSASSVKYIAK